MPLKLRATRYPSSPLKRAGFSRGLDREQIADQSFIFEQDEIDEFEAEHWVKDVGLLQKKLATLKKLTIKNFNERGLNGSAPK